MRVRNLIIGALFALSWLAAGWAGAAQTTRPVRAVWYQPIDSFDKWKARGIDTLIGFESNGGTASKAQFLAQAKAHGFGVWLQADAFDPATDNANPTVVGVILRPDEPDGVGNTTPAQMKVESAALRRQTSKPLLINFDGNKIPFRPVEDYVVYSESAEVLCFDYYPYNFGNPSNIGAIGDFARKLSILSDGKPVFAVIECSNQDQGLNDWTHNDGGDGTGIQLSTKMRGPTAEEFAREVKTAIAGGAVGLVYFPDQIGKGWEGFDGTPPDVAAVMTTLNATLTVPAPVIVTPSATSAAAQATTQTTKPTTAPASKPTTQIAAGQLRRWFTLAKDYNHGGRIVLTYQDGKVMKSAVITDKATIDAIDAAASK